MKTSPFILALATMICWGIAPLFGKAALLRIDPWVGLVMRSFMISLILLVWGIVSGHIHELFQVEFSTLSLICAEGVLASLLGHLAYFYAIKYGMISRVIPITSAFPLIALLGGLFLFSERISWDRLVGTIMIIAGIIIIRR
ncbi:MAG: EamA family transporter [Proteobacteria bacterium]|nr:EamA family transporter [Pseudomonadota bacterium]